MLISALAQWSPIMAEVEFVPSWCYPFVVVFSQVCVRWGNVGFTLLVENVVWIMTERKGEPVLPHNY